MELYSPLISRRLTALQLGHLPAPVLAQIHHDLAGVDLDQIEARLTPQYVQEAVRRAIAGMPKPRRYVAIQAEFPFIAGKRP